MQDAINGLQKAWEATLNHHKKDIECLEYEIKMYKEHSNKNAKRAVKLNRILKQALDLLAWAQDTLENNWEGYSSSDKIAEINDFFVQVENERTK